MTGWCFFFIIQKFHRLRHGLTDRDRFCPLIDCEEPAAGQLTQINKLRLYFQRALAGSATRSTNFAFVPSLRIGGARHANTMQWH